MAVNKFSPSFVFDVVPNTKLSLVNSENKIDSENETKNKNKKIAKQTKTVIFLFIDLLCNKYYNELDTPVEDKTLTPIQKTLACTK